MSSEPTPAALAQHQRMFNSENYTLEATDPEFVSLFASFAFDEVLRETKLDDRTRFLAILATCLGCGGREEFRRILVGALEVGLDPVAVKEVLYQLTAYLGIARTYPFFFIANEIMDARGIALPLPGQGTTTPEDRVEKGEAKQVAYFGEHMRGFASSGAPGREHINRWLSGNCFGDYYTRGGLSDREREMITFCCLSAQGGCEPQLTSHASANLNLGNDEAFMVDVVSQCLPYIGYPRSLNALRCLSDAVAARQG